MSARHHADPGQAEQPGSTTPSSALTLRATMRKSWHRTKHGMSCTLALGDLTVLVLRRANGVYYRRLERPGQSQQWRSLRTKERRTAQQAAAAFLVEFARHMLTDVPQESPATPSSAATLEELTDLYFRECARLRDNSASWVTEKRRHMETVLSVLGATRRADRLTTNDLDQYASERIRGLRILAGEMRDDVYVPWTALKPPVKARTVQAEIKTLMCILNFATKQWRPDGTRYLDASPVAGYKTQAEANPRRPIPDDAFCRALRASLADHVRAADGRRTTAEPMDEGAVAQCVQRQLHAHRDLLVYEIACTAGRRIGSIAALRWEDVDVVDRTIVWRKEHDKRGKESRTPIANRLCAILEAERPLLEPTSPWLFPMVTDPTRHMRRDQLAERHRKAIRRAGLEPIPGTVWHGYRRAWATDHQGGSETAAMRLAGWQDSATFRTYIGPHAAIERDTIEQPIRGL